MNILLQDGRYALIDRGHEYVVACGFNEETMEWTQGYYFSHWNEKDRKARALLNAVDDFFVRTKENYIQRCRLEELATKFAHGFKECDENSAIEFFEEECELSESEMKWFGINESEE